MGGEHGEGKWFRGAQMSEVLSHPALLLARRDVKSLGFPPPALKEGFLFAFGRRWALEMQLAYLSSGVCWHNYSKYTSQSLKSLAKKFLLPPPNLNHKPEGEVGG